MSTLKHKHHIIPKHMGGTDDPSNLIEVTVEEHAELHKILWLENGKWQDKIAWLALSGRMGKEEIIRQVQIKTNLGRKQTPEHIEKVRQSKLGKKQSSETIEKRVNKLRGQKRALRSEEWKRKISETRSKQGNPHWIGKKHAEASKEKIRQSKLGHTYNRGRKFSKIECEKCGKTISKNRISVHQNGNKCTQITNF